MCNLIERALVRVCVFMLRRLCVMTVNDYLKNSKTEHRYAYIYIDRHSTLHSTVVYCTYFGLPFNGNNPLSKVLVTFWEWRWPRAKVPNAEEYLLEFKCARPEVRSTSSEDDVTCRNAVDSQTEPSVCHEGSCWLAHTVEWPSPAKMEPVLYRVHEHWPALLHQDIFFVIDLWTFYPEQWEREKEGWVGAENRERECARKPKRERCP